MTLQPGSQKITIHILSNISRSKDNQAMKFGQLGEYNTRFSWKIIHKMRERIYSKDLF